MALKMKKQKTLPSPHAEPAEEDSASGLLSSGAYHMQKRCTECFASVVSSETVLWNLQQLAVLEGRLVRNDARDGHVEGPRDIDEGLAV